MPAHWITFIDIKYIDRIGYRIPTDLAERIGKELSKNKQQSDQSPKPTTKKVSRPRPIQRSLTPHFDCCPETYHDLEGKKKWRPIQCFVSLTDNLHPNTGGFEAVPGFHREFDRWTKSGRISSNKEDEQIQNQHHPRPCVGEYTHLNPSHDQGLLKRVQHIPVKAGSAVFWDNRIPHGNAYKNNPLSCKGSLQNNEEDDETSNILGTSGSRAVVYCSFLPNVEVNRSFMKSQVDDWKLGRAPRVGDRWIKHDDVGNNGDSIHTQDRHNPAFTELGRLLLGLDEW